VTQHYRGNLGYGTGSVVVELLVKGHDDVERVPFLFAPSPEINFGKLRVLRHIVGERGLVEVSVHSSLSIRATELLGPARRALTLYYDDRELLEKVLRVCQDAVIGYLNHYLEAGEKMIHVWWFYASSRRETRR